MPWISKELYKKLPRYEVLKTYSYKKLVRLAENTYGLHKEEIDWSDKADLIYEILEVEKRLEGVEK
jgi:hypothetical protein